MDPATVNIIANILQSGPIVVLGVVCWILWQELKAERQEHMKTLRQCADDKSKTAADYQAFVDTIKRLIETVNVSLERKR